MMNLEFILQISVIRVRVPATCGSPKSCTDIFIRGNPFSNPFRISLDNVSNAPFFYRLHARNLEIYAERIGGRERNEAGRGRGKISMSGGRWIFDFFTRSIFMK